MAFLITIGHAQQGDQSGMRFEMPTPTRSADQIQFTVSEFTFARIMYTSSDERNWTNAWAVDWPEADFRFSRQVEETTGLPANTEGIALELTDPALSQYPFIYIVEGGKLRLNDDEVAALRNYLAGGGFLIVDDFWGDEEWRSLADELLRVFPDQEPVELWPDHEIFRSFYDINEELEIPGFSERQIQNDRPEAAIRGLIDSNGRLMILLCHNIDLGDAWEHAADPEYPSEFSRSAAMLGINSVIYALAQ
jgi:hypothetical protein